MGRGVVFHKAYQNVIEAFTCRTLGRLVEAAYETMKLTSSFDFRFHEITNFTFT